MASGRKNDFSINTIIGPNTSLQGNIEAGGFTRVDGSIRGDVRAKGRVVVGERARMKSNISGKAIYPVPPLPLAAWCMAISLLPNLF